MKLTRKQAIQKCRNHWQWLAEHPEQPKSNYGLLENGVLHDCYACEYSSRMPEQYSPNCDKCFLLFLWCGYNVKTKNKTIINKYKKSEPYHYHSCEFSSASPYKKWKTNCGSLAVRKKAALKIVEACDALLKKYKKVNRLG